MSNTSIKETRIVMMSPELMRLYEVQATKLEADGRGIQELKYEPITFCEPHECLDMLTDVELDETMLDDDSPESKADRIERQWGELELRLSFFTDSYKWQ